MNTTPITPSVSDPAPQPPRSRRPLVVALAATGVVAVAALTLAACAFAGQPSPAPAHADAGGDPKPAPSDTPHVAPVEPEMCTVGMLTGSVVPGSGGTAGGTEIDLALENVGTRDCTLQGWPGVSFVGDGNGTQLGTPAKQDRDTFGHETVTIRPGGTAYVPVDIADAADYSDEECGPKAADGFRVYTPGETESLFIPYPTTACTTTVGLLTVSAVQSSAR